MIAEESEPSDEHLIRATLAGDEAAYARLASRFHPRIARMVWRFAAPHEVEDVIQDILLRIWQKLGQFRGEVPFEHWLSRLALRECYNLLRKRQRKHEETIDPEAWERMRDTASRPEDSQAARELLEIGMQSLNPEERMVITLLELEEHTLHEISDLTGWSEGNVKVRAYRARQKLKIFLEKLNESR